MKEEWRSIKDYEGLYEVSNKGRVRRVGGKVLKQWETNWGGYFVVTLSKEGREKAYLVHRLVAVAFVPNPRNVECVNHLDESRTNNHADNLEWVTKAENNRYGTAPQRTSQTLKKYYETRLNPRSRAVRCVELDIVYPSITKAAEEWDLKMGDISLCLTQEGRKTSGGLHWEYVEDGYFEDRGESLRIR